MRDRRAEFHEMLPGAVILAPMTKGSNLPFRRLCQELGATISMGEMAVSRQLVRRSRPEYALLKRHPEERFFGVQLAGRDEGELEWSARLAVERGADLIDLNCGCPIHEITRRGLGSCLLQKPAKLTKLVQALRRGAGESVPVTVKIRLAYDDDHYVHQKIARAAVEGGADAVIVHGRTREGRYRSAADWDRIKEVVEAIPNTPVIGNGDLWWPHEIRAAREKSGVVGVMIARGALIKPWIFLEAREDRFIDVDGEDRLRMLERYVALGREHFGEDERGTKRLRGFLLWHLQFLWRYTWPVAPGEFPHLQERQTPPPPRSPLEALLARKDALAHEWWADRLLLGVEAAGECPKELDAAEEGEIIPEG